MSSSEELLRDNAGICNTEKQNAGIIKGECFSHTLKLMRSFVLVHEKQNENGKSKDIDL
jgi:hypothetical protein